MMETIRACRSCGGRALHPVLDLGRVPLANALRHREDLERAEDRFPLTLVFCPECALVQIRETVAPDVLFRHYLYLSSFSETMLEHARQAATRYREELDLGPRSLVVEIASNDGYLLKNFVEFGVPVLGIDPARNVADTAERRGVPTLCEFFGVDLARRLVEQDRRADLILANNVVAHVADANGFAEGVARLLKPTGTAILECPWLGTMLEYAEFDTIYHEHLCYFSLHALSALFARHGLRAVAVERLPLHGGSLRVFLRPDSVEPSASDSVESLLAEEAQRGMTGADAYRRFAERVESLKQSLLEELDRRKQNRQRLAAYGASAKGSTLMNVVGIGSETLEFVVDRSTVKQGLYTPGNHLPILPPEVLAERQPDAVLLLTWNFAEEIFRQQATYLEAGGRFLVPLPELRVVGQEVLS
jgi:SAM-dependent methyltransferase